jgi:thymidylate synthase ThyX
MWVDVVITATEWDNFLYLRCSKEYGGEGMAQPEFMHVADSIKEALKQHVPTATPNHMPYFTERLSDFDLMTQMLICSARCARVSYKPFNSDTENVEKDEDLAKKLKDSGHMSPFEHCAVYNEAEQFPYQQWKSYRRIMEHAVN